MLTACTSEDDVVVKTNDAQQIAAKAIGFDVYMPQVATVTRAGSPEGVMTTDKLKTGGYGVFAYYHDASDYEHEDEASNTPDFMFNEHLFWQDNVWKYSPLKYWPNETTNDSQSPAATAAGLDKLSFFAYAPFVSTGAGGTLTTTTDNHFGTGKHAWTGSETYGITAISKETKSGDPLVEWQYTNDLDKNVDLLWGVASSGMNYQAVNGNPINKEIGLPLLDMVKPDKDQQMKFLFQHALSRLSLSVVSAIDQIAPGDNGNKFDPSQSRVLIESIDIYGTFSTGGVLNLNNTEPNVANWTSFTKNDEGIGHIILSLDCGTSNGYIAPDLRYVASQITAVASDANSFAAINRGVLPSETVLLSGDADPNKETTDVTYAYGTVKYKKQGDDPNKSYVIATTTESSTTNAAYTKLGNDYIQARAASAASLVLDGTTQYYTLGLPSVSPVSVAGTGLTDDEYYYYESGNDLIYVQATGDYPTGNYYLASSVTETPVVGANYAAGTYYTGLIPRYFMFAPSENGVATKIGVRITYHVVTKDTKLSGNVAKVDQTITKETELDMKSGKSYDLKLILGLTSVKLDATVADWQVGSVAPVNLPQNVE